MMLARLVAGSTIGSSDCQTARLSAHAALDYLVFPAPMGSASIPN